MMECMSLMVDSLEHVNFFSFLRSGSGNSHACDLGIGKLYIKAQLGNFGKEGLQNYSCSTIESTRRMKANEESEN